MTMNSAFPWQGGPDNNKGLDQYAKNPNGSNFPPQPVEQFPQAKTLKDIIDRSQGRKVMDDGVVVGTVHSGYNKPGQGVKHDAGKQKFDLIPFDLMDGEQRVWEKGAVSTLLTTGVKVCL
jgi:hypothetical protein